MFQRILLLILVSCASAGAQSIEHPDFAPAIGKLRAGEWNAERIAFVVEQLTAHDEGMWAGSWLVEADAAIARGELKMPVKLRKAFDKELAGSIPKETTALIRDNTQFIDVLCRAKRGADARVQVERMRGCLQLWPDKNLMKRLKRMEKKVAGLEPKNRGQLKERQAKKLSALQSSLDETVVAWLDDGVVGFEDYGSATAFRGLAALATGDLADRFAGLKSAAVKAGLTESLTAPATLLVLGHRKLEIRVDGKKVGTQVRETLVRSTPEEDLTHRFDFRVWPRSRISLVQPAADDDVQFHGSARNIGDAVCLQLVIDGKSTVPNWKFAAVRTFAELTKAKLARIFYGRIKPIEAELAAEHYAEGATHQVEYKLPNVNVVVPHPPAAAAYFTKYEGRGVWITGGRQFGSFVFDCPSDLSDL